MFDADRTAQTVHADLQQLFAVPPASGTAAVAHGRLAGPAGAAKGRIRPQTLGALAAAVLAGAAAGSMLPRPAPAPAPARPLPAPTAPAPDTPRLQVLLREPAPAPARASTRIETLAEPQAAAFAKAAAPRPAAGPALAPPPPAPRAAVPAFAAAETSDDGGADALDMELTEADWTLADTYRQARRAGAPAWALREIREDWQALRGTAGSSRIARLNAYRAQINAARRLIDETDADQAEDELPAERAQRRFGRP